MTKTDTATVEAIRAEVMTLDHLGSTWVMIEDYSALAAERDKLRAENERLRYVLGGVYGAIKTGRNEPLMVWRDQIEITLEATK